MLVNSEDKYYGSLIEELDIALAMFALIGNFCRFAHYPRKVFHVIKTEHFHLAELLCLVKDNRSMDTSIFVSLT